MYKFALATALVLMPALGFADSLNVQNDDAQKIAAPEKPAYISLYGATQSEERPVRAWRFAGFLSFNDATQLKADHFDVTGGTNGSAQFSIDPAFGFGGEARWRKPNHFFGLSAGANYDLPSHMTSSSQTIDGNSGTKTISEVKVELLSIFMNANFYFGRPYVFIGLNGTDAKITGDYGNSMLSPGIGGQVGAGYEFSRLMSLELMYRQSAFNLKFYSDDGTSTLDYHRVSLEGLQAQLKLSL